jgi:hypothetical protein
MRHTPGRRLRVRNDSTPHIQANQQVGSVWVMLQLVLVP